MARKKSEKPKVQAIEEETKLRPVRLDLTPETHRLLRLIAAYEDVSMANYARDQLENHLKEEAKRRGIK
jgi:hypothetical protein